MEKTPSFVYLDKSDTFYCYGCRTGYNVLLSRFSYIKSMYSALKIGGRFPLSLNLDFI